MAIVVVIGVMVVVKVVVAVAVVVAVVVEVMVIVFVCVAVLWPSQPNGSCRARSVYLTTRLLGRLSPLSG